MYFIKTPFWLRLIYRSCIWRKSKEDRVLYLSFDDGPHPEVTPFVLEQLAFYNAQASFFCIGKNVQLYPDIYAALTEANHTVGNHTQNHMNGWENNLFRPPYGRIRFAQIKALRSDPSLPQDIIMWDVLSGDFDTTISGDQCAQNVIQHAGPGSIIVFHDSAKSMDRLKVALPKVLSHFSKQGYQFKAL